MPSRRRTVGYMWGACTCRGSVSLPIPDSTLKHEVALCLKIHFDIPYSLESDYEENFVAFGILLKHLYLNQNDSLSSLFFLFSFLLTSALSGDSQQ